VFLSVAVGGIWRLRFERGTLQVESLGWDYRPVTVANFGFRFGA